MTATLTAWYYPQNTSKPLSNERTDELTFGVFFTVCAHHLNIKFHFILSSNSHFSQVAHFQLLFQKLPTLKMQLSSVIAIVALLAPLISAAPAASMVRVQMDGLDELAEQREITLHTVASFPGSFTDGFIEDLEGHSGVTCQAFSDNAGTKKVGGAFGVGGATFNGGNAITIATVKCS